MSWKSGIVLVLLANIALCASAPSIAIGRQIAPLAVEDVLQISTPRPPIEFSPDGNWLVYAAQTRTSSKPRDDDEYYRTGVPWWGIGSDIFIINIKTHETRNLTGSNGNNWLPAWSPDGRYVAFLSDREGTGQAHLWVWDVEKNELKNRSELRVRMEGLDRISWTPDGLMVLLPSVPVDLSLSDYAKETHVRDQDRQGVSAIETSRSTVMLYATDASMTLGRERPKNERLSLKEHLRDLSLIEVSTGRAKTITPTSENWRVSSSP